jgi:hypothetical protein
MRRDGAETKKRPGDRRADMTCCRSMSGRVELVEVLRIIDL